ncbi:MAG: response regulator transcription factor [bacterium]|nr:response regulator transcription factor [bacterium]
MAGETILIVEDDPAMRRGLKDNFAYEGYTVETAEDGEEGLDTALRIRPDLILLDIMLPGMNGYEVCQHLRDADVDVPIIMLTAKGQESDICLGLNLGADDYVTKPFSIRELLARVAAFLRRRGATEDEAFRFGQFELSLSAHKLWREGQEIALTPKEFAVLALLVQRAGRALTRDEILRVVWGHGVFVTTRSVDRCITTLRTKIESNPRTPRHIQTVREIGYRFEADDGCLP